jgi:hypothetical protein
MSTLTAHAASDPSSGFLRRLNSEWHERASYAFLAIVLAHWAEHLVQAIQVFVLGWPRPQALGVLGLAFPWLVSSEALHYGYAIVMLIGLWLLRPGYQGRGRAWWTIALLIQFWHHIEHAVLQYQAIAHHNWFGSPVPVSFVQALFPKGRVELHLFYNAVVFVPMVIAMFYHLWPSEEERATASCTCALKPRGRDAAPAR